MKKVQRVDSELCQRARTALGGFDTPKVIVDRAQGCHVWDTFGNKYIDFTRGMAKHVLGYGQAEIAETISCYARAGFNLAQTSKLEIRCAERIKELFPWSERVVFFESRRDALLSLSYLECEKTNAWAPRIPEMKAWTDDGTLFFLDEEDSAFRVSDYSLAKQNGIRPSLILIANFAGGIPLYAIAGSESLIQKHSVPSKAHNTMAFAAAIKTMDMLSNKFPISLLEAQAKDFQARFNQTSSRIQLKGYPTFSLFSSDDPTFKQSFFDECLKTGILTTSEFFFSFPHINVKEEVLSTFSDIITKLGVA